MGRTAKDPYEAPRGLGAQTRTVGKNKFKIITYDTFKYINKRISKSHFHYTSSNLDENCP